MANGEYQDLIAFLGRHFTTIDRRFEAIDRNRLFPQRYLRSRSGWRP